MDLDDWLLVVGIFYVAMFALAAVMTTLFSGGSTSVDDAVGVLYLIGLFSAVAVCGYVHIRRQRYATLGYAVVVAAALAALLSCIAVFADSGGFWKFTGVVVLGALLGAHTALLLLMDAEQPWFRYSQYAAIAVTWILGLLLLALLLQVGGGISPSPYSPGYGSFDVSRALIKAVSVFSILDLCATIIAILLWRIALRESRMAGYPEYPARLP